MATAPSDLGIVLHFLRTGEDWTQARLGEAAGVSPNLLNDYERGRKTLTRPRLEHLISFMGIPSERIDETLACLAGNRAAARPPAEPGDRFVEARQRIEAVSARCGRMAADFTRSLLTLMTFEGEALHARQRGEQLWGRLKRRTPAERLLLVEKARAFRHWALCERVTAESRDLAANHPRQALEAAELAVRIAELVPGEVEWSLRLQGWALFHVANGHRTCQNLAAAKYAFSRAEDLWKRGASGDPGLLNEAVPFWIEAALRRAERRFPEALKRIDEALALEEGELRAQMLLTKSSIFQALGDPAASEAALAEAAPLIDASQKPRLALVLRFNLVVDLCALERFDQAALRLGEVQELADRLGEVLDLQRVVWLRGKVAAGLGDKAAAEAVFKQTRRLFEEHGLAYDYALVSLDLSLVLLEDGRLGEVRQIAEEMLWIFKAQRIHREAVAALQVFYEAGRAESATVELARLIRRFLNRSQHDPELRFEGGAGAR